eukprot:2270378-Prymnesium_polylepis.1
MAANRARACPACTFETFDGLRNSCEVCEHVLPRVAAPSDPTAAALQSMGFSAERVAEAMRHATGSTMDEALSWLVADDEPAVSHAFVSPDDDEEAGGGGD